MLRFAIVILLLPVSAVADGYGFMTPSGNIYCNGAVEDSFITCQIIDRTGTPPQPRPASCAQAWGHAFGLSATGPARLECSYAPSRVNYTDVAPYGQSANFGDIICRSETTGLTCRNRSGHGFSLSRRSQRLF